MCCEDEPVIVREQQGDDYEAIRHVYAEAFRRPRFRPPQNPGSVPPEVGLFETLWEAGDAIPEFSFTALTDGGVVGHVTASQATVAHRPSCCRGADWRPSGSPRHRHRERPDGRASRRC
jgi:predicted N-acetyltransferase YhbS